MRRHDEDLWDFRSDPAFGNNSDAQTNNDQQADTYRNLLKTGADSSSLDDIDNMTFVMKDGQASFIRTPEPTPEPEPVKPAKKKHKASKQETTTEEAYKDVELFKTPEATKEPVAEVTETETSEAEKAEDSTPEVSEPEIQATEETKGPEAPKSETTSEDVAVVAATEVEPVNETTPEESVPETTPEEVEAPEEVVPEENPTEDATAESEPTQENIASADNADKFAGDFAVPKDILEGTAKRVSSERKSHATDDDFILAKPHSKKKHHSHSHSHHSHHHHHHHSESDAPLPNESVDDYVYAHYRKQSGHHHHHHHSHHSTDSEYMHTTDNIETAVVRSTTSPHFRSKNRPETKNRKWKSRPTWQKILIILAWVLGIAAVLFLIAFILFLIFSRIGIKDATNYDGVRITAPSSVEVQLEENGTIHIYKGKKYMLNTDIANVLCIGVDKKDINATLTYDEDGSLAENGQADALFWVALNTKTGKTTVLSIPRDTMADINIYNKDGKFLQTDNLQICQSYAYGDGKETSCLNTVDSVQRLFYQLPVQTYFAMDLSAIAPLNDTVGGIRVTLKEDFCDSNMIWHPKGKTLILYGDDARKYLQYREVKENASSIDRLERQIDYLKLFTSRTLYMTKKDITTPISLYNIASENSISNLDVYKISGFARCLMENGVTDVDFKTIPGKSVESDTVDKNGERYNEYYVNEEAFYELFLETFFVPVN